MPHTPCLIEQRYVEQNQHIASRKGCESDSDQGDLEHAEKLRQVKAVLEEQRTFWNGAGRKFLRDIQEGSTEAAEVGW
ncbi:unnamed protein product [Brassica napus]|uniref:(rape) hypothetical protein n=1 Tax=Brassica napus TaxID=3708 RepID=A0A816TBI4_BRANA|nr:unnamed protein product [Brassica napus]